MRAEKFRNFTSRLSEIRRCVWGISVFDLSAINHSVKKLIKLGYQVQLEKGCGHSANFPDAEYEAAGGSMVDYDAIWSQSNVIFKVRAPDDDEIQMLSDNPVETTEPGQNFLPAMHKSLKEMLRLALMRQQQ